MYSVVSLTEVVITENRLIPLTDMKMLAYTGTKLKLIRWKTSKKKYLGLVDFIGSVGLQETHFSWPSDNRNGPLTVILWKINGFVIMEIPSRIFAHILCVSSKSFFLFKSSIASHSDKLFSYY